MSRVVRGEGQCTWFYRGDQVDVAGPRRLAQFISDVFDEVYDRAPWVKNELLNRRLLSSSAAAARRELMQAMLEHPAEVRLGIEGNPPEFSMYRSFVEEHGLHRYRHGTRGFGVPKAKNAGSLRPAYEAIRHSLQASDGQRLPIQTLYAQLEAPPYGLKAGVLPVLLLSLLLHLDRQVAVYEDDSFVAKLDAPVIERLLRSPDKFEIQHFQVEGARGVLLSRMLTGDSSPAGADALLPLVRQLVRFMRELPDYSRYTKTVSPAAQRIREAVFVAKEPAKLVFETLPAACGLEKVPAGAKTGPGIDALVDGIRHSLRELGRAYPELLSYVGRLIREALELPAQATQSPPGALAARGEANATCGRYVPEGLPNPSGGCHVGSGLLACVTRHPPGWEAAGVVARRRPGPRSDRDRKRCPTVP